MEDKKSIFSSISSGRDSSKTNESASSPRLDEIEKKIKLIDEKISKVVSQKEEELKYRQEILDKLKKIEEKKEPDNANHGILIKEIASELSAGKVENSKNLSRLEFEVNEIKKFLRDYYKKYEEQTKIYAESLEEKKEINKNLRKEVELDVKLEETTLRQEKFLKEIENTLKEIKDAQANYEKQIKNLFELNKENDTAKNIEESIKALKEDLPFVSSDLKRLAEKIELSNKDTLSVISKQREEFNSKIKELKETQASYEKDISKILLSLSEIKNSINESNNPIISKLEETLSENKKNSDELALVSTDIIQALSTKFEKIATILSEMPKEIEEKSLTLFLERTDKEYYLNKLKLHYENVFGSSKRTALIIKEVLDDFNKFSLVKFPGVSGELIKKNLIKLEAAYSEFKTSLEETEDISKGL